MKRPQPLLAGFVLAVLSFCSCTAPTPRTAPAPLSVAVNIQHAQTLSFEGKLYLYGESGRSFFVCPTASGESETGYPDDERCFRGPYSEAWQAYSQEALLALDHWLAKRGIQLYLMLYPDPWEIAEGVLHDQKIHPHSSRAAQTLTQAGFSVIDPAQEILQHAPDYPLMFYYDRFDDVHPDVGATDIAARLTAQQLQKKLPHLQADPHQRFTLTNAPTPAERRHPLTGERLQVEHVLLNGEVPALRHPDSPVLVIGNSISATPYAGEFAARLGAHLGVMPDYIRNDGSGIATAVPRRLLRESEEFLSGKQAVILVLSYPQLFYRWQNIQWLEELLQTRQSEQTLSNAAFAVQQDEGSFWEMVSRDFRSASTYTAAERDFIAEVRQRQPDVRFVKTAGTGSTATLPLALPSGAFLLKCTIATSAPPGYLQVRLNSGATTLNDYEETLYIPCTPEDELLTLTSELPETLIGVADLRVYRK